MVAENVFYCREDYGDLDVCLVKAMDQRIELWGEEEEHTGFWFCRFGDRIFESLSSNVTDDILHGRVLKTRQASVSLFLTCCYINNPVLLLLSELFGELCLVMKRCSMVGFTNSFLSKSP